MSRLVATEFIIFHVRSIRQMENNAALTPYVYIFELVSWLATLTAHNPTIKERTSFN
jgi:hypothetical protein